MTFKGTRMIAALAAAGIAIGLGACTTGGTAVESLGATYSENDITAMVNDINSLSPEISIGRTDAVNLTMQMQAMKQMVAERSLADTSDAALLKSAKDFLKGQGLPDETDGMSQLSIDILGTQSFSALLQEAAASDPSIQTEIAELMSPPNVVVNPRYLTMTAEGLVPATTLGDVIGQPDTSSSAQ